MFNLRCIMGCRALIVLLLATSLPGLILISACASPSLHIAPAHKGMSKKDLSFVNRIKVPVIDGRRMPLREVDGVPVASFFHVYLLRVGISSSTVTA